MEVIWPGNYRDNPLGMGGVMAKRYGELVQDLWNGHSKSITPLKFRVRTLSYVPECRNDTVCTSCSMYVQYTAIPFVS